MAVTGTPTTGNDTLTGDGANDTIDGLEGNDSIAGGGGADTIYGDVQLLSNGGLDSNQPDNSWSLGSVPGWFNTGSGGVIERWGDGFLGLSTADGSAFIELDANSGGGLDHVQTNVDLETGVQYELSFGHAARSGSGVGDSFEITLNGTVVATINPSSTSSFTYESITITGLTGTETIGFREISGQSNGLGILLDNIQISLAQSEVDAGTFTYDDTIDGGTGNDNIYGQEGDDRIIGGLGNDYLVGGIGDDVFVLNNGSGADVIGDFVIGEDLLDVTTLVDGGGAPVRADDVVVTSDGEGGSILTFPNGESVRLVGIPTSQVDTNAELGQLGILCFAAGTRIQTDQGPRDVAALKPGNLLECHISETGAREFHPIRRIFRRTVKADELAANPKLLPVRIKTGALGKNLPERDLLVSRQHRMLMSSKIVERMFGVSDVLVPAIKLTDMPGIEIDESVEHIEYFHILLDEHRIIFAEQAPAESLFTGTQALASLSQEAREEIVSLYPELLDSDHTPKQAAPFPQAKKCRRLLKRHADNAQPLVQKRATTV